jgi:hypothetical protein
MKTEGGQAKYILFRFKQQCRRPFSEVYMSFYQLEISTVPVPKFIDPVFAKTSPKRSFWTCFRENWVSKFGHWSLTSRSKIRFIFFLRPNLITTKTYTWNTNYLFSLHIFVSFAQRSCYMCKYCSSVPYLVYMYWTILYGICRNTKGKENTSHPSGVTVQRFIWSYFKPTMNLHKNAQKYLLNRERRYTVRNVFSACWIAYPYRFSSVENLRKMLFLGDLFSFIKTDFWTVHIGLQILSSFSRGFDA